MRNGRGMLEQSKEEIQTWRILISRKRKDEGGLELSCPNTSLAIMCIWCFCLMAAKCSIVPSVAGETLGKCLGVTGACARFPCVPRRPLIKVPPPAIAGSRESSTIVRTISNLLCSSASSVRRKYLCWMSGLLLNTCYLLCSSASSGRKKHLCCWSGCGLSLTTYSLSLPLLKCRW